LPHRRYRPVDDDRSAKPTKALRGDSVPLARLGQAPVEKPPRVRLHRPRRRTPSALAAPPERSQRGASGLRKCAKHSRQRAQRRARPLYGGDVSAGQRGRAFGHGERRKRSAARASSCRSRGPPTRTGARRLRRPQAAFPEPSNGRPRDATPHRERRPARQARPRRRPRRPRSSAARADRAAMTSSQRESPTCLGREDSSTRRNSACDGAWKRCSREPACS
jgi:hypothetical protein